MKALSFRQPWAELVLRGRKTMDLRTYTTHHRGPLAIHASQTVERDACRAHGLDPDALDAGGIVGVVDLVDVIPLNQADYEAHRDQHLAGRGFREPIYGWVLASPQRLPQVVPARGRMSLFNVDLEAQTSAGAESRASDAERGNQAAKRPAVAYQARVYPGDPDRPFSLHVQPLAGSSTSYALALEQRVLEPAAGPSPQEPRMTAVVTLNGDNLRAVANHVIEALRQADYKATDLSSDRHEPFYLPEAVGVRLGLVLMAVKPLTRQKRVEAISDGIRQMPLEEAYYWYSKCTAADTAERAQRALRILLADE